MDLKSHFTEKTDPSRRPVLVFPEAALDPLARPLLAAAEISRFADVVLVGRPSRIRENALSSPLLASRVPSGDPASFVNSVLDSCILIDPADPSQRERRAAYADYAFRRLGARLGKSRSFFDDWMREPLPFGIMTAVPLEGRGRDAHCVLGGLATTSRDFFLPCLRLHPRSGTVFTAALFAFPDGSTPPPPWSGGIFFLADVAVVIDMTPERLADITLGAACLARDLFCPDILDEARAAVLSYSTRGSGNGPSVEMIRAAERLIRSRIQADPAAYRSVSVTTELQFAPAVLRKAAEAKLDLSDPAASAAGRANVLIAPSLDVGNILFHLHVAYFPGISYVLLPCGFAYDSALDFSRSSKVDDVVLTAAATTCRLQRAAHFDPAVNLKAR